MEGLQQIENAIGDVVKTMLGNDPLAISLFVILFFVLIIVFSGLDLTVGLMIMIPVIVFLTAYEGFPAWLMFILVIGMGITYYFALKQAFNR